MEKITNYVVIDLEDYMNLVNKLNNIENNYKDSSNNNQVIIKTLFHIGNKIIDKNAEWEIKKIIEIFDDENDKTKNIDYYLKEIRHYLEEYIDDKKLIDVIIQNLLNELKEQTHDKTSE